MADKSADAPATSEPAAEKQAEKPEAPKAPPSLLSTVVTGVAHMPPRIMLYGVHGIGKSTFAAEAPSSIFIPTEDGANEIDVPKFPVVKDRGEVMAILRELYSQPHDYKTLVLDSVDWFEDFIQAELRAEKTEKELGYGRESLFAESMLSDVLGAFSMLRKKRKMSVIVIAHSEIKRFDSPMTEPYDRYQPKLTPRLSSLLQEWADVVAFATYDVAVKKEEVGFNREVRRGISSGDRVLYTEERPAFYAKNRYKLPPEMPLNWGKFSAKIPYYSAG
jgi:hypothetical protein